MEDLFKKLRNKQKAPEVPSFADALFKGRPFFVPETPEKTVKVAPVVAPSTTERAVTLQALEKFTQDKNEAQGAPVVRFPGGELAARTTGREIVVQLQKPAPSNWEALDGSDLLKPAEACDLLFLGEYDTQEQSELLTNMINALKLTDKNISRYPLPKDELDPELWPERIGAHLFLLQPKVLVSLGAQATNLVCKKRERLTQVHGKFVTLKFLFSDEQSVSVQLFPIFHPEFLIINPNMKRTAWVDLQKIMEFFSK